MKKMIGKVLLATLLGSGLFSAVASAQYGYGNGYQYIYPVQPVVQVYPGYPIYPGYPVYVNPPIVVRPVVPVVPIYPVQVHPYYPGYYYGGGYVTYRYAY